MLTNPIYAGAYAFGRTGSRTYLENGRKRVVNGIRRERDEWEVLIREHHDGYITYITYITWTEYERNQRLIADNANYHGASARGAVRKGEALLAGLLRWVRLFFVDGPRGFCQRHGKSYLTRRRRGGEGGGGGLLTGRAIPSAYRWAWCPAGTPVSWKSQYASRSRLAS